jgi:photosystem II stability/assembly factor-like uncharacterized protein
VTRAKRFSRAAWLASALGSLLPSVALANGRFPLANQLVVDPMNPKHMVARATFGILDTYDDGATWTWICEDAVGYFGQEDPSIAVTASGTTLVASSIGLSVSHDGGCSWTTRKAGTERQSGIDVTINPMNPHEALALESRYGDVPYSVFLLKTSDDGDTWTEVGALPVDVLPETVEIAPSNPDRVYVSARINPSMVTALLRSDDGGQTWTQKNMDLPTGAAAFIGAVDPQNPDVVYVRAQVPQNTLGRVHQTLDAGATWTQIWRGQGEVAGFALSADGATLALGGPEAGISLANTSNLVFTSPNTLGPSCLTWSRGRLYACAKESTDFFSIGASDDKGVSFVPLLHFPDVTPRACGAATSAAVCASSWSSIASTIGADAGVALDASIDAPVKPPDSPDRTKKVEAAGGWNCAMGTTGPARGSAWALVVAALVGARRARAARAARTKQAGCARRR